MERRRKTKSIMISGNTLASVLTPAYCTDNKKWSALRLLVANFMSGTAKPGQRYRVYHTMLQCERQKINKCRSWDTLQCCVTQITLLSRSKVAIHHRKCTTNVTHTHQAEGQSKVEYSGFDSFHSSKIVSVCNGKWLEQHCWLRLKQIN